VSDHATRAALRTAACLAFKHIDEVGASEREGVLVALVEVLPDAEARLAEQMLFHFREERKFQLELALALESHRAPGAQN
jgi:hypothetical protein